MDRTRIERRGYWVGALGDETSPDTDIWDIAAGPVSEEVMALIEDVQAGDKTASEARSLLAIWARDLFGFFGSYDTVRLVGFLSSIFWQTPVGRETDLGVRPRLQYLYALQIEQGSRKRGSAPSQEVAFKVLNVVRNMFELNRACLFAEATTASREDLLRLLVRTEQLEQRHNGYVQHLAPVVQALAHGVATPFVNQFGWHPMDLWTLASQTSRVTEKRLNEVKASRTRQSGGKPAQDKPDLAVMQALNFDYMAFVWNPYAVASLIYLEPEAPGSIQMAVRLLEDLQLRRSGESAVLVPDAVPARTYVGFDRIDEGWFLPQPLLLAQYWIELIGDLIAARGDDRLRDKWFSVRHDTTEVLTRDSLRRGLPSADVLHSIKVPSAGDGETDCLVLSTDRTQVVVLECKGGKMSAPGRRGAPSRLQNFTKENVEKSAKQIDWMRRLLLAGPVKLAPRVGRQLTVDLGAAGESIDQTIPGVVVTLERVDALALLEKSITRPRGEWVVCLTDLLMVVEAIEDEAVLLSYMEDRYLLESLEGWFVFEKDALGFYLETGGFFNPSPSHGLPRLGPRGRFEDFAFSDTSFIVGYGQMLDARFGRAVSDVLPGASPR